MQKVLVLSGLSGSGKSTFAVQWCNENPNWLRINKDNIRQSILPYSLSTYWKNEDKNYTHKVESLVATLQTQMLQAVLEKKWNVVIDNTHTKLSTINELLKILQKYEVEVQFKLVNTPVEQCIERDKLRGNQVGEEAIRKQNMNLGQTKKIFDFNQKITFQPQQNTSLQQDASLPACVLVDIDGTVADMGSRFAFNWDKVHQDQPKFPIIRLVKALKTANYQIIFFSGRDAVCRNQTLVWLCEHFGWQPSDFELFMRPHKDQRKDSIVKKEMFEQFIEGKYFVDFVIDDRQQVVDMWRKEIGVTCLQVDYGDF
jgi:predicted kinase